MQRLKWVDRQFTFDISEALIYNVLERLRGTDIRLKAMTQGLIPSQLTRKINNEWCIQEHIGHLLDLEVLHNGRVDDFLNRRPTLRAADMSNKKTYAANHVTRNVDEIISEFSAARLRFTKRLESLDDDTMHFQSLHPRLNILMRPVDIALFTAEHDDHHLTTIRQLINR